MALKKPLDLFGKKVEKKDSPVVESNSGLRQELNKVESLSQQIYQLQQELTQQVVKNDLESLVLSQISSMNERFEYLQKQFKESNQEDISKFKSVVSEITGVINNLIENEIPRYKKQITSSEVRITTEINDLREDVENKVQKFYQVLNEFNDVVQVIDSVSNIEKYIQEHHSDLVNLREEVFEEINQLQVGNLQENIERLEKKIDYIRETYSSIDPEVVAKEIIQEGLLNEPPDSKNSDPLTPLDQNFVTVDQLQGHYRLFINRIQQQLATFGGGGETRLKYLDDIVGIATNASAYDGKFLKYDHPTGKFVFETVSGGGGVQGVQGIQGIQGIIGVQGITGIQGVQGITGAGTQGLQGTTGTQGTSGSQGTTGTQGIQGITGAGTQGAQGTSGSQGTTGTQGIQGITGAGTQGITGTQGTTGTGVQGIQGIQGPAGSGGSGGGTSYWEATSVGINTISNVGIGTTNPTSRLTVSGDVNIVGVSTFAGITTVTGNTLFSRQLSISGVSTFVGITTSTSSFFANQLSVVGVSTFVGIATVTGNTLFSRQLNVSGVSTFVLGPVIIGTSSSTGTLSQPLQVTGGAYVSGSVGVGTTNPRENLDVIGSIGVQASGATNRFEIVHNSSLNSLDFIFV